MARSFVVLCALLASLVGAHPGTASGSERAYWSPGGERDRPDLDEWRPQLLRRLDGEAAGFGVGAAAFAVPATIAGLSTRQRSHFAPQVAFASSGLTAYHLIPLATLGLIKAGLVTTRAARPLRRSLRGAAWTLGVASGITTVTFGVFMVAAASWQDTAWSFAIMQVPLGMITATVMLSVWADRLARLHRGEAPMWGQRGRPIPQAIVGPGALVIRW